MKYATMKLFAYSLIIILSVLLLSCGTESTPIYNLATSVTGEGTVSPSSGEFEEGETVTLTATPSDHWVFSNWSGDGSGTSSTVTITMNGNKNVVGNFQRRDYPLTITIEGDGSVEERIISQPKTTEYQYGTYVQLTAVPDKDWGFIKWGGDKTSTNSEIEILIESDTEITAYFERVRCVNVFEPVDFTKSHEELFYVRYPVHPDGTLNRDILREIVSDLDASNYGMNWIATDYNNNGIMDLVGMEFTWDGTVDREPGYTGYERKRPIRFFKGNCDGTFEEDMANSGKFLGLVHPRKLLQGDFNKDGYVDFFFVGHGYDKQPFPGEFPKLLLSDGEGGFTEFDFTSEVAFFHGGSTGDFNNNGLLDVMLVDNGGGTAAIYENNNGRLYARRELINQNITGGMFNVLFHDINQNGYLDLLLGGHDWDDDGNYTNTPLIIYGNGSDFAGEVDVRLPPSTLPQQGIMTDAKVYDINGNGRNEIIMARTGDPLENPDNFYASWSIQILELQPLGLFADKTTHFIEDFHGTLTPGGLGNDWIPWLLIDEKDGVVRLTNEAFPFSDKFKEWTLQNGFFYRTW